MDGLLQILTVKALSLKTRVRKLAEPEGEWKTIRGRRVFIGKGQSLEDALGKSLNGNKYPSEPVMVQRKNAPVFMSDLLRRFKTFGKVRDHLETVDNQKLNKALSLIERSGNISGDTQWFKSTISAILKSRK